MKLALDPGHGGTAPGATSNGIVEKTLVMKVASALAMTAVNGCWADSVVMTRSGDHNTSHSARGDSTKGCDLVLSIHANAADFRASGLMAFYWPGNRLGRAVADQIQRSAPGPLSGRSRKDPYAATITWPRVRYVLKHHRPTAVLVELGFLTSRADSRALKNEGVIQELVACMLCGVARARTLIG